MTKLIHKTGDIFTTSARAVGHGINVKGAMASGIALQFKKRFPDMHMAYMEMCKTGSIDPGELMVWEIKRLPKSLYVYNIASQELPGANARYHWLGSGVQLAMDHAESVGVPMIALPRIGSGIGGLDQQLVEDILVILAESSPIDIELWTYERK